MISTPRVYLKPGRDAPVQRRHPWVFSGGIGRITGDPEAGDLVAIHSADGKFLAWGHYSPASQIRVRLFSWVAEADPNSDAFWGNRLKRALAGRAALLASPDTTACRLIHAESDGVPGLIVDRYNEVLVLQCLTAGAEVRKQQFATLLGELCTGRPWEIPVKSIFERSEADVRDKEGLAPRIGRIQGGEPPEYVDIVENGLHFYVDVRSGHKTGFYLDQRENRQRLRDIAAMRKRIANEQRLLNVFAYTGGFAVYGLAGGVTSVVNIDTSREALKLGRENLAANGFEHSASEDIAGDAFDILRQLRQEEQAFDIIVLDPPKFAFTQKDVQRAARGYKDINLQALQLLRPDGILLTFSCSGAVSQDLFQKIVFGAALDSGRQVQITGWMGQGFDHPVALTFPESAYLKGLICRAVD